MVKASEKHDKGVFVAPTGSGKSFPQGEIVAREILKGGFRVILVKTPRISLSNQISNVYSKFIFDNHNLKVTNGDFDSILVHSGKAADVDVADYAGLEAAELVKQFPQASLDTNSIKNKLNDALKRDIPFVIFTTYHSNETAYRAIVEAGVDVIHLDINDEGHFLTQSNFNEIFGLYEPKRRYSFTATMRTTECDSGCGMNNTDTFGEIIYQLSIAEAIEKELILPIAPTKIKSNENVDSLSELKAIAPIVRDTFTELAEQTQLEPKLLVCVQGSNQIKDFLASKVLKDLVEDGVKVLTVHSDKRYTTLNGKQVKRNVFDSKMNEYGSNPNERMIIMHYDILSEGIDIQGLTGVLILRNMELSKFLQTVGRVIRVYRENGIKSGKKVFGAVFFPELSNTDVASKFDTILSEIQADGYIPDQLYSEYIAIGDEDGEEVTNWSPAQRARLKENFDFYFDRGFDLNEALGLS